MSRHARRLPLVLAALLAGVALALVVPAIAPGSAPPSTASFTAVDLAWQVTGDPSASSVTIAAGGTVTFGYPSGRTRHNADFSSGPAPTSCAQTAGTQGGTPPPLPTVPTAAGWSGTCRFDTPGTYAFHCDLHASMHGTIVVVDTNAPPPTTGGSGSTGTTGGTTGTGAETGSTPPSSGTTGGSNSPPPAVGRSAPRVRLSVARAQRGALLRGSVTTPAAGSRIDVAALVSNAALATRRLRSRARAVRVGERRLRSRAADSTSFTVALDAAARSALRRRHSLTVTLRVVVTPPGGRAVARTARVVVRRALPPPPPSYVY